MKKLLGIMVLGLLWCNVGFAETIISGSVWKVFEKADFKLPNNPYTIKFLSNGNCKYGPKPSLPCTWVQTDNKLSWELNYYSRNNVTIYGDTFEGTVNNDAGQTWATTGTALQ